jgi:hypothetical protein
MLETNVKNNVISISQINFNYNNYYYYYYIILYYIILY